MESKSDNASSVDSRISPSTNSSEGQQFNSENKPKVSLSPFPSNLLKPQDHNSQMSNATTPLTNDQTPSPSMNSHLGGLPSNLFVEPNLSPLVNDSTPSSLPSQSPQNPSLLHNDSTNTKQPSSIMQQENKEKSNSSIGEIQDLHSSFASSTNEPSLENTLQVPTITTTPGSQEVVENHDHEKELHHQNHDFEKELNHHTLPLMEQDHSSFPSDEVRTHKASETHAASSNQEDPLFTIDVTQNQHLDKEIDKNHEGHNPIETHASSSNQEVDPLVTLDVTQNQHLDKTIDKNYEGHNPSETHVSSSNQEVDPLFTIDVTQNQHLDKAIDKNHEGHNPIETHASSSNQEVDPLFTLEATQNQHLDKTIDKNHEGSTPIETHASSSNQEVDPLFTLDATQNQHLDKTIDKNHEGNTPSETHASSSNKEVDPLFTLDVTQNQQLDKTIDKNHEGHTPSETHASSSNQEVDPFFTLEVTQNQQLENAIDKNHEGQNTMAMSNLETDTTTTNTPGSQEVVKNHDHEKELQHHTFDHMQQDNWNFITRDEARTHNPSETHVSSSSQELDPLFTLEVTQNKQLDNAIDKNHEGQNNMASNNLETDTTAVVGESSYFNQGKKLGSSMSSFSTASESSTQDQMLNNSINASSNKEVDANLHPKLENDFHLALESSDDDNVPISSMPMNENQPSDVASSSTSRTPSNVFSSNTSKKQWITDEKAAETMREVIMEHSVNTGNKSNGDLIFPDRATPSNRISKSYDPSHPSNGSTKSFAFKVSTDKDKSPTSKRGEERRNQRKQSQQLNLNERSARSPKPKSTSNSSHNKWLCCFSCSH